MSPPVSYSSLTSLSSIANATPLSVSYSSLTSLSSIANATPLSVQSNVLTKCQTIISTVENNHDWFVRLNEQPQSVIVAPNSQIHTSSISSRRDVRIQVMNKHYDITVFQPTSPPSSSPFLMDESTPILNDYVLDDYDIFHIPTRNNKKIMKSVTNDPNSK